MKTSLSFQVQNVCLHRLEAFSVQVAWVVGAKLLSALREPAAYWFLYTHLIPLWCALALAAAYYGRAMARGLRPTSWGWALAAALVVLPAGAAWSTSGWDAGLTVALALAAWIPFAVTWAIPLARLQAIRGRLARSALVLLCAGAPLAGVGLSVGVTLLGLATAPEDADWRAGGLASLLASLLVIAAAVFVTRRARRAAIRL